MVQSVTAKNAKNVDNVPVWHCNAYKRNVSNYADEKNY